MADNHDLTQGGVWKKLFSFFLPVAAGGIVQQLYNTVDGLIVGKYCGTLAFAAISGSVTQILNLMVGTFISLTGGAAVYIAQLYGAGDKERIKKAIATSMVVCAGIGILISVLGVIFAEDLLSYLNTPADTKADAAVYLKLCFASAFAVMLYNMGASIIRASGDSARPFKYLCACCVTNIVLDYVLVKILHMGVFGAAAATAFSQLVSFVLVLIRMLRTDEDYRLRLSFSNMSGTAVKASLRFGIPSAVQQVVYGVTNTAIQVAINGLGTTIVAAWSLTGKVDGIYWAVINAAGVATMNFVGQNYGAGRIDRVKEVTRISMRNFMIFTIIVCALLAATGKFFFPFFLNDPVVVDIAYKIMLYFVIPYFIWTVIEILSGVLKGCGDTIVPTIILLAGIAGVRMAWVYTIFKWKPNVYVLALAYAASWLITAVALAIRYAQGGWKKVKKI